MNDELIKFSVPKNLPKDMSSRAEAFYRSIEDVGDELAKRYETDIAEAFIDMGFGLFALRTGIGIQDNGGNIYLNTTYRRNEIEGYIDFTPGFRPYIDMLDQTIADFTV